MNTGCFDPFPAIAEICERQGAWLHVDGAVGLWARSSPEFDSLTEALDRADSWSTDAHKWLNATYDCGFIAVKDADDLRGAMEISAPYLKAAADARDSYQFVPESSRRARGFVPLRGAPLPGPEGGRGSGRALLLPGAPDSGRARAGSGDRGDQRRGHQPGAGRGGRRRVGRAHGRCRPADPAGRNLLAGVHALARPAGDPHLGVQLADGGGRHPPLRRRHPKGCARGVGSLMAGSRTRAVLFDIDGTLISSGGASDRAWKRAFEELQGVEVDIPAVTGKGVPDPEVGRVVFEKAIGREPTEEEAEALMRRRLDHLPEEVESSPGFVVKDGVLELLERLIEEGIMLGLATGNVEEAAQSSSLAPISTATSPSAATAPIHRIARSSPGWRSRGRARLGAHPRLGPYLCLWRHPSRRGRRPRRRRPGRRGRDRRVHDRGVDRRRRRRGDPFPRRRPSSPLAGPRGVAARMPDQAHTGQPPFDRAP